MKKSLLFTLTESDIDSLIVEEELKQKGYRFNYFIETFDIIKYAFPLGVVPSIEESPHIIADKHVGYHHLFKHSERNIILPKDYIEETTSMFHFARNIVENSLTKLTDDINLFFDELIKNESLDSLEMRDLIRENLTIIAYLSIQLAEKDIKRFEWIFGRLSREGNKLVPQEDLGSIFTIVKSEFDRIIKDREQRQKKNFDSKRINARTDALVITKIIGANSRKGKTLNLYLSSSEWSNEVINRIEKYWPEVDGRKFSFLRSQKHIFAQIVFGEYSPRDRIATYEKLRELLKSQREDFATGWAKNLFHDINQKVEDLRNSIENYGLFLKYEDLLRDLNNAIIKVDKSQESSQILDFLVGTLSDVKNYIGSKNQFKEYFNLLNLKFIQLDLFEHLMDLLSDEETLLKRNFGIDPIVSIKQQLPIVFDSKNIDDSDDFNELIQIIVRFFLLRNFGKKQLDEFRISLIQSTILYHNQSYSSEFLKFLAYLVVPRSQREEAPNKRIYDKIDDIISNATMLLDDEYWKYESSVFKEMRYVQVWAARRIGLYNESYSLSKKLLSRYPDDPRFEHGICLATYCIIYEEELKENFSSQKIVELIERAIIAGERAITGYFEMISREIFEANHSIEALYNTLAYLEAKRAEIKNSKAFATRSRENLSLLKRFARNLNINPKRYPEYLSTEAYIELVESRFLTENEKTKKLEFAKEASKRALKMALKSDYTEKAVQLLEELDHKIQMELEDHLEKKM